MPEPVNRSRRHRVRATSIPTRTAHPARRQDEAWRFDFERDLPSLTADFDEWVAFLRRWASTQRVNP